MRRLAAVLSLLVALACFYNYVSDDYENAKNAPENIRHSTDALLYGSRAQLDRELDESAAKHREDVYIAILGAAFLVTGLALLRRPRAVGPTPEPA